MHMLLLHSNLRWKCPYCTIWPLYRIFNWNLIFVNFHEVLAGFTLIVEEVIVLTSCPKIPIDFFLGKKNNFFEAQLLVHVTLLVIIIRWHLAVQKIILWRWAVVECIVVIGSLAESRMCWANRCRTRKERQAEGCLLPCFWSEQFTLHTYLALVAINSVLALKHLASLSQTYVFLSSSLNKNQTTKT